MVKQAVDLEVFSQKLEGDSIGPGERTSKPGTVGCARDATSAVEAAVNVSIAEGYGLLLTRTHPSLI